MLNASPSQLYCLRGALPLAVVVTRSHVVPQRCSCRRQRGAKPVAIRTLAVLAGLWGSAMVLGAAGGAVDSGRHRRSPRRRQRAGANDELEIGTDRQRNRTSGPAAARRRGNHLADFMPTGASPQGDREEVFEIHAQRSLVYVRSAPT
jgi:hypothetical protein